MSHSEIYTNRLIKETSPYLLQHAHNPVDWYPWGEEALLAAREQDKPIIVSIGYSACHWCHVMEKESFESPEIAAIMNKFFINIKVDREERPDVDAIYMDSLQSMGLRGGWPLNVILMPDQKPFYGGTYFPQDKWRQILLGVARGFEEDRPRLQQSADGFAENLQVKDSAKYRLAFIEEANPTFSEEFLEGCMGLLMRDIDRKKGGMKRSPKFPMPSIWQYVASFLAFQPNQEIQQAFVYTLERMALGGIFDHLGGGWTRYSTDEDWKVPHFEKMLYDNGQLLHVYSLGYRLVAQNPLLKNQETLFKWAMQKTVRWLSQEMTAPTGGFYAALDADSEGVEGKFYTWTEEEIETILGEEAAWFSDFYDITDLGNWEKGMNILHAEENIDSAAWNRLLAAHQKLEVYRSNRVRPGLDDKIICGWNGLAIKGLVSVYKAIDDENALQLAIQNGKFIRDEMVVQKEAGQRALLHVAGKAIPAFLDDYAAVIDGFLALYEVTGDLTWLTDATQLAEYVLHHFYDQEEQLFFYTDDAAERLIARKKELFDNVIPSSNAQMAHVLWTLGEVMYRPDFKSVADKMIEKIKPLLAKDPQWLSHWAGLSVRVAHGLPVVVIVSDEPLAAAKPLFQQYLPHVFVLFSSGQETHPLLEGKKKLDNKTTFYLCENQTCTAPTTDVNEVLEQLFAR